MASNFWNQVLSSKDTTSSKRLVTLIISLHFIVASFVILFIAFYVIFYTTKGKVDTDLLGMLRDVLEYDFYIILSGLGFITADNMSQMMLERAKAKAEALRPTLPPSQTHAQPQPDGPPIEITDLNKPE